MAETYSQVRSGDLITADLINQMLADIAFVKIKLAELENMGGGGAAPLITSLSPSGPVRMGDTLQIIGKNFGDPAHVVISIGGELVTQINQSLSNDNLLVLVVPTILGVPDEGKVMALIVSNPKGFATVSLTLLPGQASVLIGSLTVNPPRPPSEKVVANASFVWTFPVQVIATQDAVYVLKATVDQTSWGVDLIDLSGVISAGNSSTAEIIIPQSPPEKPTNREFRVRVTIPEGVATGTKANLRLTIKAKQKESFNAARITEIVVDSVQPQPSTDIVISLGDVFPPGSKKDGAVLAPTNSSSFPVEFNVVVKEPGTYNIDPVPFVIQNNTNKRWTVVLAMSSPQMNILTANKPFPINTTVTAQAGASPAAVQIRVTNHDGTKTGELIQPLQPKFG